MKLLFVTLHNVFSYEHEEIELSGDLVVFRGENGSGKCLPGNTIITDARTGQTATIKEWKELLADGQCFSVYGLKDNLRLVPVSVLAVKKTGRKKILRISFDNGVYQDMSLDHPIVTDRGLLKAKDIKEGYNIQAPRVLPCAVSKHFSCLTDPDIIILAAFLSEGCLTATAYKFSSTNTDIVCVVNGALSHRNLCLRSPNGKNYHIARLNNDKVVLRKAILDLFDAKKIDPTEWSDNFCRIRSLECGFGYDNLLKVAETYGEPEFYCLADQLYPNTALRNWFKSFGLHGTNSHSKFIPELLYRITDEQIALFLSVYWACDGYVSDNRKIGGFEISVTSVSWELITGLRRLLLRIGVTGRIRRKDIKGFISYTFITCGYDSAINICKSLCNIPHKEKALRLQKTYKQLLCAKTSNNNRDVIPPKISSQLVFDAANRTGKNYCKKDLGLYYSARQLKRHGMGRDKMLRYTNYYNDVQMRNYANSDIVWVCVKSVEMLEGLYDTYDLQIDSDNHLYALDTCITHNSSIFEAICYALYGNTIRWGATKGEVVRRGQKEGHVVLRFIADDLQIYEIKRGRKLTAKTSKAILEFSQVGADKTRIIGKTVTETEQYIVAVIGIPFDLFRNSALFGQGDERRFVNVPDSERKALLGSVLSFGRIDLALRKAKDTNIKFVQKLSTSTTTIELLSERVGCYDGIDLGKKIQRAESKITELKKQIEKANNEKNIASIELGKIVQASKEAKSVHSSVINIEAKLQQFSFVHQNIEEAKSALAEHEKEKAKSVEQLQEIDEALKAGIEKKIVLQTEVRQIEKKKKSIDSGKCSECGRDYSPTDTTEIRKVLDEYKELLENILKDLEAIQNDRVTHDEAAQEAAAEIRKIKTDLPKYEMKTMFEDELVRMKKRGRQLVRQASDVNVQIFNEEIAENDEFVRIKSNELQDTTSELSKLNEAETDIIKLQKEKRLNEQYHHFCEQSSRLVQLFGRKGVRHKLVEMVLPELEKLTNMYLSALDTTGITVEYKGTVTTQAGDIQDKLDVLIHHNGEVSTYESFSGGEKKRILIASSFAVADVVARYTRIEFFLADEPFSALDDGGKKGLSKLLRELTNRFGSLFVITHDEQIQNEFDQVIEVRKVDGISHVVGEIWG